MSRAPRFISPGGRGWLVCAKEQPGDAVDALHISLQWPCDTSYVDACRRGHGDGPASDYPPGSDLCSSSCGAVHPVVPVGPHNWPRGARAKCPAMSMAMMAIAGHRSLESVEITSPIDGGESPVSISRASIVMRSGAAVVGARSTSPTTRYRTSRARPMACAESWEVAYETVSVVGNTVNRGRRASRCATSCVIVAANSEAPGPA
jgi:hypothetical protein